MKTTIESLGRMHNPAHAGEILKEIYMWPLGVTITQAAEALGVSRKHVSAIVNGRAPVSPDMAAQLAGVFGTEPDSWINLQAQYDLWQVRQHGRTKVKLLEPEARTPEGPQRHARGAAGTASSSIAICQCPRTGGFSAPYDRWHLAGRRPFSDESRATRTRRTAECGYRWNRAFHTRLLESSPWFCRRTLSPSAHPISLAFRPRPSRFD